MIITVCGFKGGVGKTTTCLHLAAYFAQQSKHVLLVDGDPNHSSLNWSKRGNLPFKVCSLMSAPRASKTAEHIIIDTEGHPDQDEIEEYAAGSDVVVLPCPPNAMSIDAVLSAIESLKNLDRYGVILTMVDARKRATTDQARAALSELGIPVFKQTIRQLTAFEKAALEGCPVYDVSDRYSGIAWGEYKSLGKEIESYAEEEN